MNTMIKRLHFKNFLSSGNQGVEFNFSDNKNLILLHGENGSGKSIFLDALFFGLLGKPFRNIKINSLQNRQNKENCVVEIDLVKGENTYKIVRGLNPKKFYIYQNNIKIDETSHSTLQIYLQNYILEGSKNILSQFIINDKFKNFMKLSKWEKRQFLEEIINYLVIFSEMNRQINFKKSDLDKQLQKINIDVKVSQTSYNHLLEEKNKSNEEVTEKLKQLTDKLIEIKKEIENIEDIRSQYNKVQKDNKKIETLERDLYTEKKNIENLINKHNQYEKNNKSKVKCPNCNTEIDLFKYFENYSIDELITSLDEVTNKYTKLKDTQKAYNEKTKIIKTILDKKERLMNKAVIYKENYLDLKNKKSDIKENLDEKIETLKKTIKEFETNRKKLLKDFRYLEIIQSNIISDDGLRRLIIRNIVPFINKKVNHYLNVFNFSSIKIKFNEDFDAKITIRGEEITYESLSEGEKSRVDFSILFAFLNFIQLKAIFQLNLLCFDEVCRNLDAENTASFLEVLRNDPLFENKNIIMISHKEINYQNFNSVYKITKSPIFTSYNKLDVQE
jgi:DNA repair exonuclease SbcCD ATPase subunit